MIIEIVKGKDAIIHFEISDNLEIDSGTGRTCNKVTQAYVCRCGQLQNKPYCDGSHKAAGF